MSSYEFYCRVDDCYLNRTSSCVNKSSLICLRYLHTLVIPLLTGRKEGNVLFNDALNTFYLRLYGVKHMIKDHSDSEKENPLLRHKLLFPINSKGSFICTILKTG